MIKRFLLTMVSSVMLLTVSNLTELLKIFILTLVNEYTILKYHSKMIVSFSIPIIGIIIIFVLYLMVDSLHDDFKND